MIKKDKLLRGIEAAAETQKRLVPLLNKHLSASVFLSALKTAEKEEMIRRFKEMALMHARHIEVLEEIREEVNSGEDRVY